MSSGSDSADTSVTALPPLPPTLPTPPTPPVSRVSSGSSAVSGSVLGVSSSSRSDWAAAADRAEIERRIATGDFPLDGEVRTKHGHGLVFGINSDREHVDAGVADVDRGPVTDVVIDSIETLGETHLEIRDSVDTIVESGADLHLNDTRVVIDSGSSKSVLGVLDSLNRGGVELQRAAKIQDVRDWLASKDLTGRGRAPLGSPMMTLSW